MNRGAASTHRSLFRDSLAVSPPPIAKHGLRPANGRGRLMLAFEALETFPALAQSSTRLLTVIADDHPATADIISADVSIRWHARPSCSLGKTSGRSPATGARSTSSGEQVCGTPRRPTFGCTPLPPSVLPIGSLPVLTTQTVTVSP